MAKFDHLFIEVDEKEFFEFKEWYDPVPLGASITGYEYYRNGVFIGAAALAMLADQNRISVEGLKERVQAWRLWKEKQDSASD